jgi:probable HAF family extracellular repeat protein
MQPRIIAAVSVLALAASLSLVDSGFAQSPLPGYVIAVRDLGTIEPGAAATPFAINNNGEVTGMLKVPMQQGVPFLSTPHLGTLVLHGVAGWGIAINDHGQVVGQYVGSSGYEGFLWSREDGFVPLGTFLPADINEQGQIAGYCRVANGLSEACIWEDGQTSPVPLAPLSSIDHSFLTGINDAGEVVGLASEINGTAHNFRWNASDGLVEIKGTGQPWAINNRGEILTGRCCDAQEIWLNGKVRRPGTPLSAEIRVLNAAGWAAGSDFDATHGVVWLPSGAVAQLPPLAGHLASQALAINDRGEVAGISRPDPQHSDEAHAVIWRIAPAMHVETPNTDSRWGLNTVQRLAWTYTGNAVRIRIDISRNGGKTWQQLTSVRNEPGSSQSFYWRVTGPITSAARFRVSAIGDAGATDVNDANVYIANATVEILRPTDKTPVAYGSRLTIAYRHSLGARAPVAIDVSRNNGETWRTVATTTTNGSTTATFKWTVDLTPTTRARVRIRALDGLTAKSTSRAFVVVAAAPGTLSGADSD